MKLMFKKLLLAVAALVATSPAVDARPRLFSRRCAGGACGQVQAVQVAQPSYQPAHQQRPIVQSLGNVVQAVAAVPQAVVQRVAAPVMQPAGVGSCPGGVCPIR